MNREIIAAVTAMTASMKHALPPGDPDPEGEQVEPARIAVHDVVGDDAGDDHHQEREQEPVRQDVRQVPDRVGGVDQRPDDDAEAAVEPPGDDGR